MSSRCRYSLALVVFPAWAPLARHRGTPGSSTALGLGGLGGFGHLGRPDGHFFLYPAVLLFLRLLLLFLILLVFLLLGFDDGPLGEGGQLLVYGFQLEGEEERRQEEEKESRY